MMTRPAFRSAPRVPALGRDDARRFAPWLFALMVYVAGAAGLGLIAIDETTRAADRLVGSRVTVQVPAAASPARLQTALAVLRQAPGIRSVHLLTPAETGRLLEQWLGAPVPIEELPVPRLIDAAIEQGSPVDLATLAQQLAAVVPDARIEDHRSFLDGLRAGARPLQGLFGAAIGAALGLSALLAAFTTRSALAARRAEVELLHLLGAADRDIARAYARRALVHGLIGGGIAAAALLASVALLSSAGDVIRLAAPVAPLSVTGWRVWAVLAAMAIAAGLLAAASARATALRRLGRLF